MENINGFIGKISKNKAIILGIIILAPFIMIPFVAGILKLSMLIGDFLPNWLILLEIDTTEKVSISTFIYYYTCFLAIEVTGILSYAVYKLSSQKEKRDEKAVILDKLTSLKIELKNNLSSYLVTLFTTGDNEMNLKRIIGNHDWRGSEYKSYLINKNLEIEIMIWEQNSYDLKNFFKKNGEEQLLKDLTFIYERLEELKFNRKTSQLKEDLYEKFDEKINIAINSLEESKKKLK